MKSSEEKRQAIAHLRAEKGKIREISFFGDNNWEAIDKAIEAIEEDWDDEEMYEHVNEEDSTTMDWVGNAIQWNEGQISLEELLGHEPDPTDLPVAEAVPEMNICKKLCKECPFSNQSLQGWLADYTIDDIANLQSYEKVFPCHMMMTGGDLTLDEAQKKVESGELKLCRGYVESMIKSGKMPRNNKYLMEAVKAVRAEGTSEESMAIWTFRTHHTR